MSTRESGTVLVNEIGITSDLAHFADRNLHGSVGPFQNFVRTRSKRGLHLEKNSRYVQIANDGFSAEVVVVMCTLIKKKIIIIKLLGYGYLKSATESEFLPSLREDSFDHQKCKTVYSCKN